MPPPARAFGVEWKAARAVRGPFQPEGAPEEVDERGIELLGLGPAEAEPFGNTWPEVVDQDIGATDQLVEDVAALLTLEVDADAVLAHEEFGVLHAGAPARI